jgi:hypothetical protein
MSPVVVHVVRPYESEQEYLSAEAWSIEPKSMLLIDADELPFDTAVLFDVALSDGHKPIRAEGRVVCMVAAEGDRPGGLRVRFKRFGAATKAFIERAVKTKQGDAELPSQVASSPSSSSQAETDRASMPEVRVSMTDLERISVPEVAPGFADREQAAVSPPSQREPSGVRPRVAGPVAPPANREELLERLRQRRRAG